MRRNSPHDQIHVKCNMEEPIELLVDKLSTKSSDLYIFWVPIASRSKTIAICIVSTMRKYSKIIS